jgi:hypothetical protein
MEIVLQSIVGDRDDQAYAAAADLRAGGLSLRAITPPPCVLLAPDVMRRFRSQRRCANSPDCRRLGRTLLPASGWQLGGSTPTWNQTKRPALVLVFADQDVAKAIGKAPAHTPAATGEDAAAKYRRTSHHRALLRSRFPVVISDGPSGQLIGQRIARTLGVMATAVSLPTSAANLA